MSETVAFPPKLQDALWHTTSVDRYRGILKAGWILVDPPVPDSERWKANCTIEYLPYVRMLGGVSLFEFKEFNPAAYSEQHPLSTWHTFVPFRRDWGKSIWIEIDPRHLGLNFIGAERLLQMWKEADAYSHTIMPRIEAASLVSVPVGSFKRVLKSSSRGVYELGS